MDNLKNRARSSIKKWPALEQQVYYELRKFYQNDDISIARQMKKTFPDKIYQAWQMKEISIDSRPNIRFTFDEIDALFPCYIALLKGMSPVIWRILSSRYKKLSATIMARKFLRFNKVLIRKLAFYYAGQQNQYLYDNRITKMTISVINGIFYFGVVELNCYESSCKLLQEICDGCHQLYKLVCIWIDLRLYYNDSCIDMVNQIPRVSESDFQQIMETVLTLEICLEITPFYQGVHDQILYKPTIELEYEDIPPKIPQLFLKHGTLYQNKRNLHGTGMREQTEDLIYPVLSYDQIQWVLRSQIVQCIFPYLTLLKQESGINN